MHYKLLIEGIVRQTTVLLAQISTSSGIRAPLARVADQVFFNLTQEIEAQGITKAVVADMFGIALRTYQKKVRRMEQSATESNRTLWEAVYAFICESTRTRQRVFQRFHQDGEREVGAVLSDLLSSGLIFVTGTSDNLAYGANGEHTRAFVQTAGNIDALANVVWLQLFQKQATSKAELQAILGVEPALLTRAVQELLDTGRVVGDENHLEANNLVIAPGGTGKEAAMLDHYRAVAKVLAAKTKAGPVDLSTGGATFVFSIFEHHPHAERVRTLFADHSRAVRELWQEVSEYNRSINLQREDADQITFYLGQVNELRETEDSSF
jgi:hypothetical protein